MIMLIGVERTATATDKIKKIKKNKKKERKKIMAVKVTKKDRFAQLRVLAEKYGTEDLVEFIDHEVELLTNKSSKKSPTKTQKENESVMTAIKEVLGASADPMTVADIMTALGGDYTNQKISALLTLMGARGTREVFRTEVKKKAYFRLAVEGDYDNADAE